MKIKKNQDGFNREVIESVHVFNPSFAEKLEFISNASDGKLTDVRRALNVISSSIDPTFLGEQITRKLNASKAPFQIVELLRNTFVLMPILFTWYALYYSVTAYAAYLQLGKGLDTPFLILWQRGFDDSGFLNFLKFGEVAFLDSILVLVIILLTILSQVKNTVTDQNNINRAFRIVDNVDKFVWEAYQKLSARYSTSLPPDQEGLEKMLSQFEEMSVNLNSQMDEVLNFLAAEHERLSVLSENQKLNVQSLENATDSVRKLAGDTIDLARNFKSHLSGLSDSAASHLKATVEIKDNSQTQLQYLRLIEEHVSFDENVKFPGNRPPDSNGLATLEKSISNLSSSLDRLQNIQGSNDGGNQRPNVSKKPKEEKIGWIDKIIRRLLNHE